MCRANEVIKCCKDNRVLCKPKRVDGKPRRKRVR